MSAIDLSIPPSASAPRRCRLGFIGLGWIGRKRLLSVAALPQVQVAAVADPDAQRRQQTIGALSNASDIVVADSMSALLDHELDGVVIATPSALHAPQAIEALQRGIAVFCQKPLAVSAADTRNVIATARRADRLLQVDYCYRQVRGMTELRQRIRQGALGKLLAVDLTFHNAYAPGKAWCLDAALAGGGCLIDLGTHLIDLLLWLLDAPSTRVVGSHLFAQGRRLADAAQGIEDYATAELSLGPDAVARLSCSWNVHAGRDAIIEVFLHGTKAGAIWRNVNGSFYDFEVAMLHGAQQRLLGSYPDDWGSRALTAWINALQHGQGFDPDVENLLQVAQLIDACYGRAREA